MADLRYSTGWQCQPGLSFALLGAERLTLQPLPDAGADGVEHLRGLGLIERYLRRDGDPARRHQVVRVAAFAQLQIVMLDGIRQALDLIGALGRYLHRLDVLVATLASAHGADVNRPAVGEIENGVGDRQAADLPTALPVRHDLGAAWVDVHDCDVISPE